MNERGPVDLRWLAAATAVVIATAASAMLLFRILDILLLLFLGIILAAALQPWHTRLCRWGVPKGLAVLLIYVSFLVGLFALSFVVLPVLVEQIAGVVGDLPTTYANLRASLAANDSGLLHLAGQRLPPFEKLTTALTAMPELYQGVLGATFGIFGGLSYAVLTLAIGFYWTMEVPRFERFCLSWLPVARRTSTLNAWREIEFKLGAFVRGQVVVMIVLGLAAGLAYALIGLPNALALGVIAGLSEAVPLIGPLLAAGPAVLVALPLGLHVVFVVVGIVVLLQLVESYALSPMVMNKAVGVSALLGLLAILAFGALYGMLGVLIAIPVAAVGQVLLDTLAEGSGAAIRGPAPLVELRRRLRLVRERARGRLRTRDSRMGIDPDLADHVVDAVDQRLEEAAERIEALIAVAQDAGESVVAQDTMVQELELVTASIESAVDRVAELVTIDGEAAAEVPLAKALGDAADEVQQALERAEAQVELGAVKVA